MARSLIFTGAVLLCSGPGPGRSNVFFCCCALVCSFLKNRHCVFLFEGFCLGVGEILGLNVEGCRGVEGQVGVSEHAQLRTIMVEDISPQRRCSVRTGWLSDGMACLVPITFPFKGPVEGTPIETMLRPFPGSSWVAGLAVSGLGFGVVGWFPKLGPLFGSPERLRHWCAFESKTRPKPKPLNSRIPNIRPQLGAGSPRP